MSKKTNSALLTPAVIAICLATTIDSGADPLLCSQVLGNAEASASANTSNAKEQIQRARRQSREDTIDGIKFLSQQEMRTVAKALILSIENYYGPLKLKKTTIGLDWQAKKNKLFSDITEMTNEGQLLFAVSDFLHSFNDAHISIQIPSSLRWRLPLQASYVTESSNSNGLSGKYILNYIDRAAAQLRVRSGELPPLGAELIGIDGQPVSQFQKRSLNFNHDGNDLTNRSMFASAVFSMSEESGVPLSLMSNKVRKFEFQWTGADGTLVRKTVALEYNVSGVGLINAATVLPANRKSIADSLLKAPQNQQSEAPKPLSRWNELYAAIDNLFSSAVKVDATEPLTPSPVQPATKPEGAKISIGQRLPVFELPKDFSEITLPEDLTVNFDPQQIFAGTFVNNGKRVGLLRIPTYSIKNTEGAPVVIDYLIRQLQMKSDYLILDQTNNPGGAVSYSDMWVKALVGKLDMTKHLHFRVRPTDKFMRQFAQLLSDLDLQTVILPSEIRNPLLKEIREQFEIVHTAYRTGEPLSEPITLLPHLRAIWLAAEMNAGPQKQKGLFDDQPEYSLKAPITYTKPIFMLINQFDFSGGDATPASLSDYKRVTLIGMRTAGAGGTVEPFQLRLMSTQFNYNLTTSLMYRPANAMKYVENYGVHPDIELAPTANDYTHGFRDYFERVLKIADGATR